MLVRSERGMARLFASKWDDRQKPTKPTPLKINRAKLGDHTNLPNEFALPTGPQRRAQERPPFVSIAHNVEHDKGSDDNEKNHEPYDIILELTSPWTSNSSNSSTRSRIPSATWVSFVVIIRACNARSSASIGGELDMPQIVVVSVMLCRPPGNL